MRVFLSLLLVFGFTYAQEVYATFSVEAKQSASLAFIVSGVVDKVNVDIGDVVKQDAVLAQLKNDDTSALLEGAKTTYKYAKKDYERQVKVKKLIDEGKFDSFANKYESAKNQLAYQQATYDKTILKAPFDGVIFAKNIEVGDAVNGMMLKTVFQIQSQSARKLVLEFDQKYNNVVKVGQTFTYSVDGDKKTYTGTISKVYPHADTKTRKVQAEVEVKNFTVGLFGEGNIEIK
ncbi:efflux RND transporter periplasmic adaptor subunit [Sulfurimonas sp.]|uniref:efflux RND transporter periplasmic adaptor subunit n=1 Tax=Sulfurimonas sp. TaxID=2022749 RepID=UPI003D131930